MKKLKTIYSIEEWGEILSFCHKNKKIKYNDQKWKSLFGISFSTMQMIWYYLSSFYNQNISKMNCIIQPIHLVWTIYFSKVYPSWLVISVYFSVDPKTIRKWINIIIKMIPCSLKKKVILI